MTAKKTILKNQKKRLIPTKKKLRVENQFIDLPFGAENFQQGVDINSQLFTLTQANSYAPITLQRLVLAYAYATQGLVQVIVDQPIDDAFRKGLEITSSNLSQDDISQIENFLLEKKVFEKLRYALKWSRLYGGGGLIINTGQNPETPLNIKALNRNSLLDFISADRWELLITDLAPQGIEEAKYRDSSRRPYSYYGNDIHQSRVMKINGKDPSSFVRRQLQGWGISVVEHMLRSLNSYLKNQNVIFELLDEAKIDIYQINEFNTQLATSSGTQKIIKHITLANQMKNYNNALVMDKEDQYHQKLMNFGGLSDMLTQNRIMIATDLKMPVTKLFGLSANGFNSGEDDIENYNSLIETEVREPVRPYIKKLLEISCQYLFGFIPDLNFEFHPLREMNKMDEQRIKTEEFNIARSLYGEGMVTPQEYMDVLQQQGIWDYQSEVREGKEPEVPQDNAEFGASGVQSYGNTPV